MHIISEPVLFVYILDDCLDLLRILDTRSAKADIAALLVLSFQDVFDNLYAYLKHLGTYFPDQTFPADHSKLLRL